MSLFRCKMCGGTLEINSETVATCEYCGTQQTLPKLNDERRVNLYDRANHFRRNNEFDKAAAIYEQILNDDNSDAESYWSLVLCRYGIEYVEDPASRKRIPTVNRAQYTAIFDDDNYRSALKYADSAQRTIYQQEARAINEIQKGILEISQKEEPFDVFICYKETDHNGRRTPDSVLANELYHQLTQEGFKVFFSRITLEDKLGVAYEPYIFAALNSAKVMVVLGTEPEYFNAVWVKNEWSRYLALIKNGAAKILIPAYRDMDPYDLPDEFSHLQAQDMSKLGFMQDLIRGIKKITQTDAPKQTVIKETVIASGNANTAPLLKRAFMFLEDGDWTSANEYCEKVLDIDPECAEAYLGKMMAELQVCKQEELKNCAQPFAGINYQKILRFGDDTLRNKLAEDIAFINERNENARLEEIYRRACETIYSPKSEEAYKTASKLFGSILGYKDAAEKIEECAAELVQFRKKQEEKRKNEIYDKGKQMMTIHHASNYLRAIELFKQIPDWKDAAELIRECKRELSSIEEQKLEAAKKRKRIAVFVVSVLCAALILALVWFKIIVPAIQYNKATALYDAGNYSEAISAFEAMGDYKDSHEMVITSHKEMLRQYQIGVTINFGHYNQNISSEDGPEPIEWKIIAKEDDRILVLSTKILKYMEYSEELQSDTSWESSSIREWLNIDFWQTTFNDYEKLLIPTVTVLGANTLEGAMLCSDTQDKLFLLSCEEAEEYNISGEAARANANAGILGDGIYYGWWLRDTIIMENNKTYKIPVAAAFCDTKGEYYTIALEVFESAPREKFGVRPAMWIDLSDSN